MNTQQKISKAMDEAKRAIDRIEEMKKRIEYAEEEISINNDKINSRIAQIQDLLLDIYGIQVYPEIIRKEIEEYDLKEVEY